jgi:hypothetical protein
MVRFFSSRRFLAIYSGCLTLVFAVTVLTGFSRSWSENANFDQITVRRMNVVEPNGTVRMVISDKNEFPGLYLHGKEIKRPDRNDSAGMLFINDEGTEDGGLIYGGSKSGSDGTGQGPSSFSHLSFDQYDQDQTLVLGASLEEGKRSSGVTVSDVSNYPVTPQFIADAEQWKMMPHGAARAEARAKFLQKYPQGAERGFFGRQTDDSVGVSLRDTAGNIRALLTVKPNGEPALQFLDASGKVTREISGNK